MVTAIAWLSVFVGWASEPEPHVLRALVEQEGVSLTLLAAGRHARESEGAASAAASRVRSSMVHLQHLDGIPEGLVDEIVRMAWVDDPETGERVRYALTYYDRGTADKPTEYCAFTTQDAMGASAGMTWVQIGEERWNVRNQGRHEFERVLGKCGMAGTLDAFRAWRSMRRMTNIGAIGAFVPGIGLTISVIGAAAAGPTREEMLRRMRRGE